MAGSSGPPLVSYPAFVGLMVLLAIGGLTSATVARSSDSFVDAAVPIATVVLVIGFWLWVCWTRRESLAEEPEEVVDLSGGCVRCGGLLVRRRRPFNLMEVLAVVALLILGADTTLSPYGPNQLACAAAMLHAPVVYVLVRAITDSPQHSRRLCCSQCGTSHERPKMAPDSLGFWPMLYAVLVLFLLFRLLWVSLPL